MEMSVAVAPDKQALQEKLQDQASQERANTDRIARRPNSSDLDEWLAKVEAMGELKRISAEVDPDLEAATITYLVGSEKSPALLFENIKGHPGHRALYNMVGCNLSRFCLMIGEEPVDHPLKAVQALQRKMGRTMKPKEVPAESAICNQNIVTGDAIDIRQFPAQRMWPLDGGLYLGTGDAVVTQCPETGRINVGTYRMMIKGPREIGVYTSPGKDATLDRDKWWKMGKPMPIAAAYGIDPLLFLVAATSFPKTESEYEYYGGINGAPIELFKSDVTGLPLPAGAEIIIEGFVYPDETFAEGPFGEFTGYYGTAERGDALHAGRESPLPQQSDTDLRPDGRRPRQRGRPVLGIAAFGRDLGRSAEARHPGHPGRVVDPGGRRLGHHGGVDQTNVCRPRRASDGARRAMHRRRLFRQIHHRGRRRHRSDQRASGAVGDGDAVAPGAIHRHPARDLEHVPRPEPQSAGNPAMGLEGADQRLHGLPASSRSSPSGPSCRSRCTSRWWRAGASWASPASPWAYRFSRTASLARTSAERRAAAFGGCGLAAAAGRLFILS